jgi:predicted N-acetyltransferase YhbS/uncharacterized glyoxalase superfamily protein PhnB
MQTRVRSITPILPVADIVATLSYYKGVLDATSDWIWGDPPVHGGCMFGSAELQFSLEAKLCEMSRGLSMFVNVVNIEQHLVARQDAGANIISDLETMPWGVKEYSVEDCNGVRLRFAEGGFLEARREKLDGVTVCRRHLSPNELKDLMIAVQWHFDDDIEKLRLAAEEPMFTAVAEYQSNVIGTGSILGHTTGNYLISNVIVHSDFQSQGVGKLIMQELDNWLSENGVPGAMVKLFAGIDRQPFYGQFGFRGPEHGLVGMHKSLPK